MINVPLSRLLDATLPHCERSWMSPAASADIAAMARQLPDVASSVGFELRLTGGDDRVDLGVAVRSSRALQEAWEDFRRLPSAPEERGAWAPVGDFVCEWSRAGSDLQTWIPFIYWEVDQQDGEIVPSVFTSFDWPVAGSISWEEECRRSWRVALRALHLLMGTESLAACEQALERAFVCLPAGGRVVHTGAMLGRGAGGVRLSVSLPRPTCARYLSEIGFDGSWYDSAIRDACPELRRVHLECDIGLGAAGRVGLVLRDASGAAGAIAYATAATKCDERKILSVQRWREGAACDSALSPTRLRRTLSHLKLDLIPEGAAALKAYVTAAVES